MISGPCLARMLAVGAPLTLPTALAHEPMAVENAGIMSGPYSFEVSGHLGVFYEGRRYRWRACAHCKQLVLIEES